MTLTAIWLASGVWSGKAARELVETALQKIADEIGMTFTQIWWHANQVAIADYGGINILWDAWRAQQDGKFNVNYFVGKVKENAGRSWDAFINKRVWIQKRALWDWMNLTDHAAKHIASWRWLRWVIYDSVLKTYKTWIKYWNPKWNQYIILSSDKSLYLPLSTSWNWKIVSVIPDPTQSFISQLIIK